MYRVQTPGCQDCPELPTCDRIEEILGLHRWAVAIPDPNRSPLELVLYRGMVN